jgi:hypothetical protein
VSQGVDLFGVTTAPRWAMHGHEQNSRGQDEWLTPPNIVNALGPFDLDPCAPIIRPWDTASLHYTVEQDGLRQPWRGLVWLNPPYSAPAAWLQRLAEHGDGIALLFVRTDTALWHDHVWPHATGFLFLRGRIRFHRSNGKPFERIGGGSSAGAPSVLIGFGDRAVCRMRSSGLAGAYVAPLFNSRRHQ